MKQISVPTINIVSRPLWSEIITELVETFRLHAPFLFLVSLYTLSLIIASIFFNVVDKISLSLYCKIVPFTLFLFINTFFIYRSVCVMIFVRPKKLFLYIFIDLKNNYLTRERMFNALPIILLMPLFISTFTAYKTIIPIMNPFSWDPTFAKIDAMIHGGNQAWQLLQPILGYPHITFIINFLYNIWFFVMFYVLYWQAFNVSNPRLRMQFFLSYVVAWSVLGTGIATLFSSAGPCYYGRIVFGEDIYRPLLEYLNTAQESFPIWALKVQEELWVAYENNKLDLGGGISAMPSMHVSMVVLFALVGWRSNRLLGIILSFFTVIIMFGSVHLGWHYAIDGYVSIVCTLIVWVGTGYIIDNFLSFDANVNPLVGSEHSKLVRWKGGGDTSGNSVSRPAGRNPASLKLSPEERK